MGTLDLVKDSVGVSSARLQPGAESEAKILGRKDIDLEQRS